MKIALALLMMGDMEYCNVRKPQKGHGTDIAE